MPQLLLHCVGDTPLMAVGCAVYHYKTARSFHTNFQQAATSCIVFDLRLGFAALTEVRKSSVKFWPAPLLVTDPTPSIARVIAAFRLSIDDYLDEPIDPVELHDRIQSIVHRSQARYSLAESCAARVATLSQGERDVLQLMLNADTTKAIAHRLSICQKTVENRRLRVFEKMNVGNVAELFKLWMMSGASLPSLTQTQNEASAGESAVWHRKLDTSANEPDLPE